MLIQDIYAKKQINKNKKLSKKKDKDFVKQVDNNSSDNDENTDEHLDKKLSIKPTKINKKSNVNHKTIKSASIKRSGKKKSKIEIEYEVETLPTRQRLHH